MKAKIIGASAGTGKTYTMAIEYIKALNKGIKFETILVITFTKKATAEIKERIIHFLDQIVNDKKEAKNIIKSLNVDINKELLKDVYKEILLNQENLKIMTNDGLINSIFKTTIAPYKNLYSYEIVDENDDDFIARILDKLIKENFEDFDRLYKFVNSKKIEDFYNIIKEMLRNRTKIYDIVEQKSELLESKKYSLSIIKEDLIKFLDPYKHIIFIKPEGKGKNKEEKTFNMSEEIKKIENINSAKDLVDYFGDFGGKYIKSYYDNKEKANIINASIEEDFKERIAYLYLEDEIFEYNKIYRKVAKICFDIENEIKFSENKLTFDDIPYYTHKYLYEKELNLINNGVATDKFLDLIGTRFHTLMIDEFQDTNAIQLKLFMPIIKTCENVLIVGDEKQAIYGFRGTDSSLFKNIDSILKKEIKDIVIEKESLDTCYRTRTNIIEYINDKFLNLNNFSYEKVLSVKEGGYVKTIQTNDFQDVVNILKENKGKSEAVIVRKNSELDEIAKLLEDEKMRYNSIKSMDLSKDKNVNSIKLLIDYIVTNDGYKLLEFLRSDLIAMTLNDLKKFIDGELEENEIIKNIRSIKKDSSDFKRKYLSYFPYNESISNSDILNINKFLDLVDKSPNLKEFYNEYDRILGQVKQENANNSMSVNLLTIHKSKGLEYDDIHVVFNAKKQNFSRYTLIEEYNDENELIDFYFVKKRKIVGLTDFGEKYFKIFEEKEEEEINNLMYVALTRPKNNLYIYYNEKTNFMNFTETEVGTKYVEIEKEVEETEDLVFDDKDFYNKTRYKKKNINAKVKDIKGELIRKVGLAVHYYMENFKYIGDDEYAYSMLLKKYGNLIGPKEIKDVVKRCDKFISSNKKIFDERYKVYSEYKLQDGKYSIDRLNIDEENKKAYIYDYKTMKNPEEEIEYQKQVENYKNILKDELKDYDIETKLLSI